MMVAVVAIGSVRAISPVSAVIKGDMIVGIIEMIVGTTDGIVGMIAGSIGKSAAKIAGNTITCRAINIMNAPLTAPNGITMPIAPVLPERSIAIAVMAAPEGRSETVGGHRVGVSTT